MATSTKQKIDSCLQNGTIFYIPLNLPRGNERCDLTSDPSELWVGMKGSGRSEIVNVIWQHNWQRGHKKQHQQNNTSLHFRLPNIIIDLIILCIQIFIFFLEVINLIGHLFPHTFHSESNNFILSNEEQYKVVRIYLHPQILVDSRL